MGMKLRFSDFLDSKGLALPAVVMVGTVVMGTITFMMSNSISEKNATMSSNNVATDTLISGVFVYADSLLKERKCVNLSNGKILRPDECDPDIHWDNPGNLARLLISSGTASSISAINGGSSNPKLKKIEFEMKREDFASSHPMRVLMEAESKKYDKMKITYNAIQDNKGIEGYFFIKTTVSFFIGNSLELKGTQKSLYAPLMVNNYSLVLNRNLTLTDDPKDAEDPNDKKRSPNRIFNGSSGKLIFDSPVLVNQNIILPNEKNSKKNKTFFQSRVDLGGSLMVSDEGLIRNFEAQKGGAPIADYPGFTGFRGGIRNIAKDNSLEAMFMSDLLDPTVPRFDFEVNTECPKYTDRKENCLGIDRSKLIFSPYNSDTDTGEYLFGMTKENEFQSLQAPNSDRNDYPSGGVVTATSPSNATLSISLKNAFTYDYKAIVGEQDFYNGSLNPMKQLIGYENVKTIDLGLPPNPKQFEINKKIRLNGEAGTNNLRIDLGPFMRLKSKIIDDWKDTTWINGDDKPYYKKIVKKCVCEEKEEEEDSSNQYKELTVNGNNKFIDFQIKNKVGNFTDVVIEISEKTYATPQELQNEINSKLNASIDTATYTTNVMLTYSNLDGKFIFNSTSSPLDDFNIMWKDGANSGKSIGEDLGFRTSNNDLGATSYNSSSSSVFYIKPTRGGSSITCNTVDGDDDSEIIGENTTKPSDIIAFQKCSKGNDGKENVTYKPYFAGDETDIILQTRPKAFLDVSFVEETNYRYKMTAKLKFQSGKNHIGNANSHWEWILSDSSEGLDKILLRMIIDPFDFTFADNGKAAASGSDCDTGPYSRSPGNNTITFRIDTKIENNNGLIWQLSDKPFGGENDDRKWYIISGDSPDDIGLIPNPGGLSRNEKRSLRSSSAEPAPPDYQTICTAAPTIDFDPVSLDVDFRKNSFDSWNFNPVSKKHQYRPEKSDDTGYKNLYDPSNDEGTYGNRMIFDDHNHNLFNVYSILDYCVVKAGAKQVMGFITCRRLKIEKRSQPLKMIGTFIVDQIEFDSGSLNKNIRWMNIFHPRARSILVDNKILRDNCTTDPNSPFWKVSGSNAGEDYSKIQSCRPADIMQKADPFRWTSFKPECGPVAGGTLRSCMPKGLYKNFISFIMNEQFER